MMPHYTYWVEPSCALRLRADDLPVAAHVQSEVGVVLGSVGHDPLPARAHH
jgi:hypothetical protein